MLEDSMTALPRPNRRATSAIPEGDITLYEGDRERYVSVEQGGLRLSIDDLYEGRYKGYLKRLLEAEVGQPGIPQSGGQVRLERNPNYAPIRARGLRHNPGAYASLATDPQIARALRRPIDAVTRAGLRIERAPMPEWLKGNEDAERARDLQHELCARHLYEWRRPGRRDGGLDQFLFELQWTVPRWGFGWWELVGDVRVIDAGIYSDRTTRTGTVERTRVSSYPRRVAWLTIPRWRAPWTVARWFTRSEELLGLEADFAAASDYWGGSGPSNVVFPAEKFLHVAYQRLGSNWEGRSVLRDIGEHLKQVRAMLTAEGLGVEIAALGETWIIEPPDGLSEADSARLDAHLDNRTSSAGKGCRVPYGTDIKVISPAQEIPNLTEHENRYRRLIGEALASDDLMVAAAQAGSYAARSDASEEARQSYESWFRAFVGQPLEDIFARVCEWNDPDGWAKGYRFSPTVEPGALAERGARGEMEAVEIAVRAGIVVPTPVDEEWARDRLSMPVRPVDEDDEVRDAGVITDPVERLQQARLAVASGIFHLPDTAGTFRPLVGLPPLTQGDTEAWARTVRGQRAGQAPFGEQGAHWTDSGVEATSPSPAPPLYLAEADAPDLTPPKAVQEAARRALEVRKTKPPSQRGMTPVGLARARDLSNGKTLSPETVRRMLAYFDRHQGDKDGETWGEQGKGWQAWMGWGGDAGWEWARRMVERLDREEGKA